MENFRYRIGEDLREVPENLEEFKKGISILENEVETIQERKVKAQKLSKLGVLYRIIGNLNISQNRLLEASKLIDTSNEKNLFIVNEIRIAQTLQFQNKNDEADKKLNLLQNKILQENIGIHLLDFIYQHRGKNLYEKGDLKTALTFIKKALEIRKKKG
ncbi:MAG: hypothetical protein ACPGVB_03465, partial [Chitinophagales bacterium]